MYLLCCTLHKGDRWDCLLLSKMRKDSYPGKATHIIFVRSRKWSCAVFTSKAMVSFCCTVSLWIWNLMKPCETVSQLSTVAKREKACNRCDCRLFLYFQGFAGCLTSKNREHYSIRLTRKNHGFCNGNAHEFAHVHWRSSPAAVKKWFSNRSSNWFLCSAMIWPYTRFTMSDEECPMLATI